MSMLFVPRHSLTVPSLLLVASALPSSENVIDVTSSACPSREISSWPVVTSHTLTEPLLKPPVTRQPPSIEKAARLTMSDWPSFLSSRPDATSHSRMVLSLPPVANLLPSGENAMALTRSLCPTNLLMTDLVYTSQRFTLPSRQAEAMFFPSGEKMAR